MAAALHEQVGVRRGDRVAIGLPNRPEYLEVFYALGVMGAVHVNTNHRYGVDELTSLWHDMGVCAVVYDQTLAARVHAVGDHLPRMQWIAVGDEHDATSTSGATFDYEALIFDYEALIQASDAQWQPSVPPCGDDRVIICTGGTTGRPKGVVWRQDDMFRALRGRAFGTATPPLPDVFDRDLFHSLTGGDGIVGLPAAPLMHSTGLVNSLACLMSGGAVITVPGRFDAVRLLDAADRHHANLIAMVGNAFARPLLDALDRHPRRWDLSSLHRIISAGMAWTPDVKRQLLTRLPNIELVDALGATEAIGMASHV
ncbi:MAG: AMP-binding enzyme, partial [Ilumatobacteraceae bacterium]|nr:AMP-binding enzyme [Ilumatobacteraceae bacterium]